MIKIIYIWLIILIQICFSNGQLNSNNNIQPYWPPVDNDLTKQLELEFIKSLEQKCPTKKITNEITPMFLVTETQNGTTKPKPSEFVQISTGNIIEVRVECEECDQNNFHYENEDYDVRDFQCITMCIFKGVQVDGECHYGSNFKIGLIVQNKFIEYFEACHALTTLPGNSKNLRERIEFIMGHYSRRIRESDNKCREKCLAVCMHPQINYSNNKNQTMNETNEVNLFENHKQVLNIFKENVCKINMDNSARVKKNECSTSDSTKIQRFDILLLLLVFIICFWDKVLH